MSLRLDPVSGLGPKEPAAFVLSAEGRRILLDLGEGPLPSMRPDPKWIGRVDALVLSHAHKDHCGAIDLLPAIGDPPVYATRSVLDRLPGTVRGEALPPRGDAEVLGIPVETGRDGHALGGIWIRFDTDGGFIYMGDHSCESAVFAFDPPPPSQWIVLDASYGCDEELRAPQERDILAWAATGPLHLPVPADGRGIDMALRLREAGVRIAVDEVVRAMLRRLGGPDRDYASDVVAARAAELAEEAAPADPGFRGAILTADAVGERGDSARLIDARGGRSDPALLFTGHLEKETRGHRLFAAGRAGFRRWNVHPTLAQNVALARAVGAETVIPAFSGRSALDWGDTFGAARVAERV